LLTQKEFFQFNTEGFLGPLTLCSETEMNRRRDSLLQPFRAGARDGCTLEDKHLHQPALNQLARHRSIVDRARQLLDPDLQLWHTTLRIRAGVSPRLDWQQETCSSDRTAVFPTLCAWIAIDPVPTQHAMQLVPRSHRRRLARAAFAHPQYVKHLRSTQTLPPPPGRGDVRGIALRPGQFMLFDGRILHAIPDYAEPQPLAGLIARFKPASIQLGGRNAIPSCDINGHLLPA
jgi:hypothetical protein